MGASQKNKKNREGQVKYFRKTLKWHNVFIDEVLEIRA